MTPTGGAIAGPTPAAEAGTPPAADPSTTSRRRPLFRFLTVPWLVQLGCDVRAGAAAAVVTLPICLSAGLLVLAPFCPALSAPGAAAGRFRAPRRGVFAAPSPRSSFIISSPPRAPA